MKKTIEEIEKDFLRYVNKISHYEEAINLMYWDLRTKAPAKSVEQRANSIATLSTELHKMCTSEVFEEMFTTLLSEEASGQISEITKKAALECRKDYDHFKKIPLDEYEEFVKLQSKAESVWEEAKEKGDFSLFQPYLEQLVEKTKIFIGYWGYEGNPYNTLLDLYEPGVTVDILDQVFAELRDGIIDLLKDIQHSSKKPDTSFLYHPFPKEKQEAFSLDILKQFGYDFRSGRLDETVHPFEITINPYDVRITTKYDEKDFRVAVFGTIHEGGHALYEQHISKDLMGTPLATGTSMGIHESQSLFHEIFIGRNRSFWEYHYDRFKKYSEGQFDHVSLDDFYRAINEVKPTLIRIEADEVTYPLHIIIRYEIEKGLFNDEIEVKDLPKIWNEKYKHYLGIEPDNDGVGVLQDVHWAGADFGYFPSYALGYMYAAQLKHAMLKEIPDFDKRLAKGDLKPIEDWLSENVHRFGKMKKPLEILQEATGEPLKAKYLINYLRDKYKEIYDLS
ncbi:carboxypeptidase M32 [Fervidibacillus halotolerans]|uniref:Metal-dependent carboxypeptidase n=1 Tax=Fervidibacillus halotolerans TaxID=2980027 RepID=A0A9E8M0I6_9BACI|nr:carboxypeptidase M32 [Fervidibacillus halotolerans]WAA13258.1 carboxypeptidase M32 [Fervidibacillus halotolerans]